MALLQIWDMQMQNAFLRHQLALSEQKQAWLENQLQESQAATAASMEQQRGCQQQQQQRYQSGSIPQHDSSRVSFHELLETCNVWLP